MPNSQSCHLRLSINTFVPNHVNSDHVQMKFVFFLYWLLSALWNENDLPLHISDIRQILRYRTSVFIQPFPWRLHITIYFIYAKFAVMSLKVVHQYGCSESCQFRPRSVFFVSWRLKCLADDFRFLHPLARDVKDTLLTRKRQLTADSDSNILLGVLLLVCHKAKQYLPSVQYLKIALFIIWKYFGKWCEAKCLMCNDFSLEPVRIFFFFYKLITSHGLRYLMVSGCR
jgi:hypothetical protein